MNKIYFLLLFACIIFTNQIYSQVTNLDVNFDNGLATFAIVNSDVAQPSFTTTVSGGVLNIVAVKRATDWSFVGMFSQNVNISALPTLQFKVKSTADVTFAVRLKTKVLTDPAAEMVQIEKSVTLTGGAEFQEFFFDITAEIAALPTFNSSKIEEIQIDCSNGWLNPFTGTVELDYLQIGLPKAVPPKGTGFVEAFDESVVPAGVIPNTKYSFSLNNDALDVNVGRDTRWFGFNYELDGSYDISANPIVNVRIKTATDMILQIFLIDADGKGYQTALVGSQYKYDELVANKNEFRSARIFKGNDFNTVTFDFSTAKATILNLKKIAKIKFVSNGTALGFNGNYSIDEIRIGDQASKTANIGQLPEFSYLKNSPGTKEILIPEIKNASQVTISGGAPLITDVVISPITYTTSVEDGISIKYGSAKLSFTLVPDATGSEVISLNAFGNAGFLNNSSPFTITVNDNNPPTIDPVSDLVVQNNLLTEVKLTGITSGDANANQSLVLTAVSDNSAVVDAILVDYASPGHYGKISFSPIAAGTAKITLTVKDNEDAVTTTSFNVVSYESLNRPPVVNPVSKLTLTTASGSQSIVLTGIDDGDNSDQVLTITAVSSNTTIIPNPTIVFATGENTVGLLFTPTGTTGLANITVTITDNGGTAGNDGNKTTTLVIPVEVIVFNPTGLEFNLSAPNALSYFAPNSPGVIYFLSIVDTLGEKAIRVIMNNKSTYDGIWMDIPQELNLSALPVLSYEIFSVTKPTWHWNYFYNAEGTDGNIDRNIQNSGEHQFKAPAGVWTTLTFDYRQPGDMNNANGTPIDASRLNGLLLNVHNSLPSWPFTNATGVYYIRNIKFGDKAVYPVEKLYATINPVSEQSAYETEATKTLLLSGISNGKGGTDGITITASYAPPIISDGPAVSAISAEGTATLTYSPLTSGSTTITIYVDATGAESKSISFKLSVLKNDPAAYADLTIDKTVKHQTIRGFGTFQPESRFADLYSTELGASVVRLGIIGNQWEPENDNEDPNVINMEGFNYNAFDWNFLLDLKAKGVESFILTSWSPPAWMKRNLSVDHKEQAIEWEKTDNILEPYYYQEFAESMVALVKAMKQEAGIDILAIGLQNEPYFNEPYPSAILSGAQFVQLIKIVGDRFKAEGLGNVGFYMPEQVFGIGSGNYSCEGYLATLKADPIADEYCQYFAVHGYDATGITPGFPSYDRWTNLSELAKEGNNPKETWMTETYIGYSNWASAMDLAGTIHGSLWAGKISLWTNWSWEGTQVTKNLPNSSFYTSKNYYKYIRPGAVMLDAKSDHPDLLVTAFENPDGKFVMVVINKGIAPVSARIFGNNLPENYHVYRTTMSDNCVDGGILNTSETTMIFPPSSVVTLVAESNVALTMNQVPDAWVIINSGETVIPIEGISDGAGSVNNLTLAFETSNDLLLSSVGISDIGTDGKATVSFTPATDKVGIAQIRLILSNSEGVVRQVTFYVFIMDPFAVKDTESDYYKIYPNPTADQLNLDLSPNQFKDFTITDITGRFILRNKISSDHISINVSSWNKGIYLIRMKGDNNSQIGRFVIE